MSYSYVAIGDSLSAGIGTSIFSPGFTYRYRRMAELELGEPVFIHLFTVTGGNTKEVFQALDQEYIRENVKSADMITVTAGMHDLINSVRKFEKNQNMAEMKQSFQQCIEHYSLLMKEIKELKKGTVRPFVIRLVSLYNPFPNDESAKRWVKKFNRYLKGFTNDKHISIANVNKTFLGYENEYLSIDRIYPNDIGYEQIAQRLHRLGYDEIAIKEGE